jgi:hypothetical protein
MNAQQYETILGLLADKVKDLETENGILKWQVKGLEERLAEAEYHLNPNGEKPKTLEVR